MFFVSFPNILCLLLAGVLVVHILSRDQTMGKREEVLHQDLEDMYCRMPQTYGRQDITRCSSAQRLFLVLGNSCMSHRAAGRVRVESPELKNETESKADMKNATHVGAEVEELDKGETVQEEDQTEKKKEVKSSLLDSIVISLLVCSAIFSLFEIYKEKAKKVDKVGGADGSEPAGVASGVAGGRRISLADLTVNRHIRRGDSQQLETIRQNSATSGKPPPLIRRSSFPAQLPEARHRPAPQRQQSSPGVPGGRRLSVDLDDDSGDRRRVRIIRRH